MNATFRAALDAELATLTRVVDPPVRPFGYGVDLSCVTDVTPLFTEVDPASPTAIIEAVTRRFITPRGKLEDDADYGLDIRAHVARGITQRDLRALAGALQGEAQKDDRVSHATVSLAATLGASKLAAQVMIRPADPKLDAFTFTFAVTDASVLMGTIN